jgi:hypothetical protein
MLGVDDILSRIGSAASRLRFLIENGDWLLVVRGVDGLRAGRDRGVDGGGALGFDTAALTVSALTSAAAILGAAMPNPRCPRLICLMNLGAFDAEAILVTAGGCSAGGLGDGGSFEGGGSGSLFLTNMLGFSISAWFIESFLAEGTLVCSFFSGSEDPKTFMSSKWCLRLSSDLSPASEPW